MMEGEIPKIGQLSDIPKEQIFRVPQGYFEHFTELLQQKHVLGLNETLQKLPFVSPDQYSDALTDQINERIDVLQGLTPAPQKDSPFKVPDQYFETLPSALIEKVLPVNVENPLELPDDYFDALEAKIHDRIDGKPERKVVALYPQMLRYAVAASVVVVLGLAGYFYKQQILQPSTLAHEHKVDLANTMIASLSKKEVQQYLEQQDVENQDLLEYTSSVKKQKIHAAFEKEILPVKIKEEERQDMELELDNVDISDITSDI